MATIPAGKLRIVNASVKPENECDVFREHAAARIPGAKFLDLTMCKDLSSPYPFMMPDRTHFVRMMKAMGIRKSDTVVVYETGKGWFASRAAFMLKSYGHPQVFILDGNFAKWKNEGRALESDYGKDDAAYPNDFAYELVVDNIVPYEKVKACAQDGSMQIVDNRPGPAFAGGSIPNSFNIPGPQLLAEDGTTKSAEQIKEIFESKGVDVNKPMIMSCTAGILSSLGYACAVKAKLPGALFFYDGSWSEYAAMKAKETAASQE